MSQKLHQRQNRERTSPPERQTRTTEFIKKASPNIAQEIFLKPSSISPRTDVIKRNEEYCERCVNKTERIFMEFHTFSGKEVDIEAGWPGY